MNAPACCTGPRHNFGGLAEAHARLDSARAVILPVPYDFSTSYQGGARLGPRALCAASENMELLDEEVGATYKAGIHTLPEVEPTAEGPAAMCERVAEAAEWVLARGKLLAMLGGEHSITAGAVKAALRRFPKLSVLQIDAHADMRDRYLESSYSHACVMRRVREMAPATSVGIRSMSEEEAEYLERHPAPIWSVRRLRELRGDFRPVLESLAEEVYVTFDLDGLDPAVVPATGTPEPGGLEWYETVDLLRAVSASRRIVGFDVVELAPLPGQVASDFLAARLVYRLVGLALATSPAPALRG